MRRQLFSVALFLLIVGALVAVSLWLKKPNRGTNVGTLVVSTPAGPVVLFLDNVKDDDKKPRTRITSVDALTGRRLGSRMLDRGTFCALAGNGVACRSGFARTLYDARSLEPRKGLLVVPPTKGPWGEHRCHTTREEQIDGVRWAVGTSDISSVVRGEAAESETPRPTFAHPALLLDTVDESPVHAGGDPLIVIGRSIARIGADGVAVWTVELGGACEVATVAQGAVVVGASGANRVLAIDLDTGEVRWRAGY